MKFKRSAGILLHPTSLPGKFGIGDLGDNALKFIDFLKEAGQTLWQVFPLGPTGYGDSPYQCFSAFAGNPLLISPEILAEEGLLSDEDLNSVPHFDPENVDYGPVINYKYNLLRKAYDNFKSHKKSFKKECGKFCEKNGFWLDDYSLFMAVKAHHNGIAWTEWEEDIRLRKKGAIKEWTSKLEDKIEFQKFLQLNFFKQWDRVKAYAHEKEIQIIGDMPIYIAADSADLWANKELFSVDKKGRLKTVAGVPPDYFSATGQLWGNPLYKWKEMKKDDYLWWRQRFSQMFELFDIIRIDHFRAFDAFWEIPGDAETAINGRWVKAPGYDLFDTVKKYLGDLPILAEDLGVITKSVEELRDHFDFPGMKVLQFAFGPDGEKKFLPHNYIENCVVYSGTHDNDTTRGFFEEEKGNNSGIFEWAQHYLNFYHEDIRWAVIKAAYASVANIVITPMQDVLNLDTKARMNFPGKLGGNWTWRLTWDQINGGLTGAYHHLAEIYDRPPRKEPEYAEIEVEEE